MPVHSAESLALLRREIELIEPTNYAPDHFSLMSEMARRRKWLVELVARMEQENDEELARMALSMAGDAR